MAGGVVNTVNYLVNVGDRTFELPRAVNCVNAVIFVERGRGNLDLALRLVQVINASSITILPAKRKGTTKSTKGTKKT